MRRSGNWSSANWGPAISRTLPDMRTETGSYRFRAGCPDRLVLQGDPTPAHAAMCSLVPRSAAAVLMAVVGPTGRVSALSGTRLEPRPPSARAAIGSILPIWGKAAGDREKVTERAEVGGPSQRFLTEDPTDRLASRI
jgi:hypothetical protein